MHPVLESWVPRSHLMVSHTDGGSLLRLCAPSLERVQEFPEQCSCEECALRVSSGKLAPASTYF